MVVPDLCGGLFWFYLLAESQLFGAALRSPQPSHDPSFHPASSKQRDYIHRGGKGGGAVLWSEKSSRYKLDSAGIKVSIDRDLKFETGLLEAAWFTLPPPLWLCVCVCVLFSHLFWRPSHGSRRDVSFTLQCIQGTTLCSVFFCPSEPTIMVGVKELSDLGFVPGEVMKLFKRYLVVFVLGGPTSLYGLPF